MSIPRTAATFPPPVMEARRWTQGVTFPADRPLINVSQAAPVDPPPPALRQAMADAAQNTVTIKAHAKLNLALSPAPRSDVNYIRPSALA